MTAPTRFLRALAALLQSPRPDPPSEGRPVTLPLAPVTPARYLEVLGALAVARPEDVDLGALADRPDAELEAVVRAIAPGPIRIDGTDRTAPLRFADRRARVEVAQLVVGLWLGAIDRPDVAPSASAFAAVSALRQPTN